MDQTPAPSRANPLLVIARWAGGLSVTNPITVRLVQNGSRRRKHLYIRSIYLGVLILVLLWSLLTIGGASLDYRELAARGAASFTWVAYLQIALICVLAPVFMAGAIAQESSPKTWDILLTTPMSPMQIVLGNLLGRLFFILALLFASMPLFALTQFFGGVPGRSILASYAIAGCAAVLVGSIAIALSVSRLVGQRAVFAFYVSVVSYLAVTAAVDAWLRSRPGGGGVTVMTPINPFLALRALLSPSAYPRGAEDLPGLGAWVLAHPVTAWCYGSAAISGVLVIASGLTVRLGGLGQLANRGGVPWYRRMFKLGASGSEYRPPRSVWSNPVAWREAAARNSTLGRIAARWSFIVLGGLWGLGLLAWYHGGTINSDDFRLAIAATVWGEIGVTTLIAVNMASTAVTREREDGTLDLLLTTPITPGQYLSGKLRGLMAYLIPLLAVPIGTLGLSGLYVAAGGLGRPGGVAVVQSVGTGTMEFPAVLPEAGLVGAVVVVPFVALCVMLGLSSSLKSKSTLSSVVQTVAIVGVITGILGLCGWNAGRDLDLLGPALAGLSPVSALYACVEPRGAMLSTIISQAGGGLGASRVSLMIGAGIAAAIYLAAVFGVHAKLVRDFDMTVRKLAGVN